MAQTSYKCWDKDWVAEMIGKDRDGNEKRLDILKRFYLVRSGAQRISITTLRRNNTLMCRNVYFANNHTHNPKGTCEYDPLSKVVYSLESVRVGLGAAWIAEKNTEDWQKHDKIPGVRCLLAKEYCPAKPIKCGKR